MTRITAIALAVGGTLALAACTSAAQHAPVPAAKPSIPAAAPASTPAASPKSDPPPAPAPAAPKMNFSPDAFWADDKKAAEHPDVATYRTKWDYLQQECTEQGQALADIVVKVQARQKVGSRWEAMNYMSALLSGPPSECSVFLG